jgi:aryl-alcohol dehydrogenase-like predicted oxidoreductase
MEYKHLGKSGLVVSAVGVGCNQFGPRVDAAGAKAIVEKALSFGVTFFDTADVYGGGKSEEYLGAALKPHRRDVVISTKSGFPMGEGPYKSGTSRRYLMNALDDCLRRLDTDYVDLYQMHVWDQHTPIEETLRTLDDMVRSGKVRYIGCRWSTWQMLEAEWVARTNHVQGLTAVLGSYSLVEREVQKDMLPVCERYGIGLIPIYPLAQGFLTGKYRPGQTPPEGGRLSLGDQRAQGVLTDKNFALLARLEDFCARTGRTILDLAVGWLASQSIVGPVITGATSAEQIEQNVKAGETRLSSDEMAELETIFTAA